LAINEHSYPVGPTALGTLLCSGFCDVAGFRAQTGTTPEQAVHPQRAAHGVHQTGP